VFAAAQIPVYYRSGALAWRKYAAGDYPFYDNSGGDNVHYNLYSAPNWSSQEATNAAKYIAMWIFGTNNQSEPIIALMGQSESSTLNAAKDANTLESIEYGTLPFAEMKVLYRLIFKSDSSWAHTEDLRSVSNIPGGTYVPSPHPISDEVYGVSWSTVTTIAPSKKAVYNKIEEDKQKVFNVVPLPDNEYIAGDANVYYVKAEGGGVNFGDHNVGTANFLRFDFVIPKDYKLGTDILLKTFAYTTAVRTFDSALYASSLTDGDPSDAGFTIGPVEIHTPAATSGIRVWTKVTFTLPEATLDFQVDDLLVIALQLDDQAGSRVVWTHRTWWVEYTSDNLD